MAVAVGAPAADYPQVGFNRTQAQLMIEIAEYSGGSSVQDQLTRARNALRRGIAKYNQRLWSFNRLSVEFDFVADIIGDSEYQAPADFYKPFRALHIDEDGDTRDTLTWIDFGIWKRSLPDQSSKSNNPRFYTMENVHESGLITVDPPIDVTLPLQWPKWELNYFRRIVCPATDNDKINVPSQVEEAILTWAIYVHMGKTDDRRFSRAKELKKDADEYWASTIAYSEDFGEEQGI